MVRALRALYFIRLQLNLGRLGSSFTERCCCVVGTSDRARTFVDGCSRW